MFSYVFMKILEMRPRSYDQRMDRASGGHARTIKEAVSSEVPQGSHVLEIGCGTGELAHLVIERGSTVEGFDLSPSMIEIARERIEAEHLENQFHVRQMGVEGMDAYSNSSFDVVLSTLVFSELNEDERRYALKHSERILKPGGLIIIADEVVPQKTGRRIFHSAIRLPILIPTYLISGKSTQPIADLRGEMTEADFFINKEERNRGDSFALLIGVKSTGDKNKM